MLSSEIMPDGTSKATGTRAIKPRDQSCPKVPSYQFLELQVPRILHPTLTWILASEAIMPVVNIGLHQPAYM